MGRHRQPAIRERLLDACTTYTLEHGLPDRLQPLVAATGTSSRMLLYHFGTRDALLAEVLRQARRRQRQVFEALLQPRPDEPYPTTLRGAWSAITGPVGHPYVRLFSWLREAEHQLWPDFRREATTDWLTPLELGLGSTGHPELATLVLGVIRGLLMDLEATDDTDRVDRAFDAFLAVLAGGALGASGPPTVVRHHESSPAATTPGAA